MSGGQNRAMKIADLVTATKVYALTILSLCGYETWSLAQQDDDRVSPVPVVILSFFTSHHGEQDGGVRWAQIWLSWRSQPLRYGVYLQ